MTDKALGENWSPDCNCCNGVLLVIYRQPRPGGFVGEIDNGSGASAERTGTGALRMKRQLKQLARNPLGRAIRKLLPGYPASSMGGPHIAVDGSAADQDVTDQGERVLADDDNFCFHAHLSIYNFAKFYTRGKKVLDAGCGTGYGSNHLLTEGGAKSVLGIDLSEKAIAFCQKRYGKPGLTYQAMDLQDIKISGQARFDVIFSSNVLEHVADVDSFLLAATRLMKPDGVFILGVPAIVSAEALEGNLENPYHINNITPPAWLTKMRRFFSHAQGYRHWVEPEWTREDGMVRVDDSIRMQHFTFNERDDAAMMNEPMTITTIIVAHGPRPHPLPKTTDEIGYPKHWNVDLNRPRGRPEGVVGPIFGDTAVSQTFVCEDEELSKLEIMMATYARQNESDLEVTLRRDTEQGAIVAQTFVDTASMRDNDWIQLEFPAVRDTKGKRFVLTLRAPDALNEKAVTAYYTNAAVPGRETLKVGNRVQLNRALHFHTQAHTR